MVFVSDFCLIIKIKRHQCHHKVGELGNGLGTAWSSRKGLTVEEDKEAGAVGGGGVLLSSQSNVY